MSLRETLEAHRDKAREQAELEAQKPERIAQLQAKIVELFDRLEGYWEPLVKDGLITTDRHPVSVSDFFLGEYSCECLKAVMAGKTINFKPAGSAIAGFRIDLVISSERPTAYITIENDRTLITALNTRGAKEKTLDLTAKSLEAILDEILS